jgi:hypothetical protein
MPHIFLNISSDVIEKYLNFSAYTYIYLSRMFTLLREKYYCERKHCVLICMVDLCKRKILQKKLKQEKPDRAMSFQLFTEKYMDIDAWFN